ncbi:MAG TPA: hypothetical protein VJ730_01470 [Nitrososphaera sp.]|jgi:hypothetical protein|nr:hypothetical protein [Nitrososphaera sp.]
MRLAFVVTIAAGIIAVALVAMFVSTLPTKDYDLSVDALKDEQSLFTNARVVVKNIGKLPLTDVLVDYGSEKEPVIPVLRPGETMNFSPPEDAPLDHVTVTAEPGIHIVQPYRAPIKLPGMIGS